MRLPLPSLQVLKGSECSLIFVHDLQVCAYSEDDVIYLRALCWASYRKSDKYVIYDLAYPRLRDGLCRYIVLTNLKQSDLYQNHTQLVQLLRQVP